MSGQASSEETSNRLGQSLVELALLLPVLMMLTLGVVDLGRAASVFIGLKSAAREGARFVTLYASQVTVTDVQDRVVAEMQASGFPGLSRSQVTVAPTTGWSDGRSVTVSILYDFPLITTGLIGSQTVVPLRASAEMVIIGSP